jgi:hypothetical protein
MKQFRIKKADLRKGPLHVLTLVGAVAVELSRAYPSHVYMSAEDYAELKRNFAKDIKKLMGKTGTRKSIAYEVAIDMLNFGPSTVISSSVRPGYVIVDTDGIACNIANDRTAIQAENKAKEEARLERQLKAEGQARMNQPGVMGAVRGFFEKNFGDPRNLSN